ncbi:MAG: hypothetical protein EPN30_01490 [Actinomycetota bacterium]|nr:MAG: hypothetical protein EPN30_01490 [Actinomycetota bacterium]
MISGDNLQLSSVNTTSISQRSTYIDWLTQNEYNTDYFGKLLAPIGVQYVVIYKTISTGPTSWIPQQKDLKSVYSSQDVELLKNTEFAGLAQVIPFPPTDNLLTLLSEANSTHSMGRTDTLNTIVDNPVSTTSSHTAVVYQSTKSGWLNLDAPYYPGWRLNGNGGVQSIFGTPVFKVNDMSGTITFLPRHRIILGYLISAITFLQLGRRAITDRLG